MIKKTIFLALALFLGFSLFVMKYHSSYQVVQHQWHGNVIKAQNFIYDTSNSYDNVIVGSSLSRRLMMDSLKGFYNLSFNGQGVFDGLKILSQKPILPKAVFIEMNFITRKEDKNFTASLSNPVLYTGKKYIQILRDGKEPLPMAGQMITPVLTRGISFLKTNLSSYNNEKNRATPAKNNLIVKLLEDKANAYKKIPDSALMNFVFLELNKYVQILKEKKVEVVFFEMPINEQLCNLPMQSEIRSRFFKSFPPLLNNYILQPDCKDYQTTDGIHLSETESLRYTSIFKNTVSNKLYR